MEKMISRRAFLLIGMQSALLTASGCAALEDQDTLLLTSLHYRPNSKYLENISSVMVSEDRRTLVVFTRDFHYIFDCPATVSHILYSPFKQYYRAQFNGFHVSTKSVVKGTVKLWLRPDAPHDAIEEAIKLGLTKKEGDRAFTELAMEGIRYKANGVSAPVPVQNAKELNRSYAIEITVSRSTKESARNALLTPITVAVDGSLLLVGASAVVALLPLAGLTMLFICSPGRGCAK